MKHYSIKLFTYALPNRPRLNHTFDHQQQLKTLKKPDLQQPPYVEIKLCYAI